MLVVRDLCVRYREVALAPRGVSLEVPEGPTMASCAALRCLLGERLPRWQLPERWSLVDDTPKTSVDKVDNRTPRAWHTREGLDVRRHRRPESS